MKLELTSDCGTAKVLASSRATSRDSSPSSSSVCTRIVSPPMVVTLAEAEPPATSRTAEVASSS